MVFRRQPRPISDLLKEFMKNSPRQPELKRGMVLHLWPEVVGEGISKATRGVRFDGHKLIVTMDNEAWRFELHANRYRIMKKLNERVGSGVVKELIVRS
ncbi:MAG: DUF721 domain-containing protein [Balneolaceae bacterium]|nr:MAG: DUF721 domain-containing protein [Balneolaceae bacterium]